MKAALTSLVAVSVLALALGGLRAAQERDAQPDARDEPEQRRKILAPVMAKKLRYSHRLMTSLATEDFAQMATDAWEVRRIGETALMKVSPNQDYVKYATEFSSAVEELQRRAKAHDLNGATLSYIRLTMNCVECHKYVRDKSIFGRNR
jgi:cytochrome c556